jgi:hypothetical protein
LAFEQRDNSGSLFKNDRKETETQPDRTGSAMIDGREYYVSGWLRETKDGRPWLSLAFKPKSEPQPTQSRQPPPSQRPAYVPAATGRGDFDDSIPFAPEVR